MWATALDKVLQLILTFFAVAQAKQLGKSEAANESAADALDKAREANETKADIAKLTPAERDERLHNYYRD